MMNFYVEHSEWNDLKENEKLTKTQEMTDVLRKTLFDIMMLATKNEIQRKKYF